MLFEAEQNPKVIQSLLGHKDVKTTISTYNSVDKSYFDRATEVLNNQYLSESIKKPKEDIKAESILENISDEELAKLLERRRRKKEYDSEM